MATTTPFPFREHHDPEIYGEAHNELVTTLIERYESNLRDSDKADTDLNQGYYDGVMDATAWVLMDMLGIPEDDWEKYVSR